MNGRGARHSFVELLGVSVFGCVNCCFLRLSFSFFAPSPRDSVM